MKALITGISGQDGYYLTKHLLSKGYEVHGIVRRNSQNSLGNLDMLNPSDLNDLNLHKGDITDNVFIENTISEIKPDEIYHLAAQSFVQLSFTNPKMTYDINIGGTLNVLNAILSSSRNSKMYFAATSEMFGKVQEIPQKETTPFYPRSPYGVSKLAGYWSVKNYRESYNLHLTNGILFNHESEMRGPEFVTRKITRSIASIKAGKADYFELGNIDAKRDWGHAADYVKGMHLMLQQEKPDDFILATGQTHSVREFVEIAFKTAGMPIHWEGHGVNEQGVDENGKILVRINPEYYRPAEVDLLLGDNTKVKKIGWNPKITFDQLVKRMVTNDLGIK